MDRRGTGETRRGTGEEDEDIVDDDDEDDDDEGLRLRGVWP